MNGTQDNKRKFLSYLKQYSYYIVLGGLVVVFALAIVITAIISNANEDPIDVNTGRIEFVMPVSNATILKGYSSTELQYNAVLNQWEIHKAIDFQVDAGANVLACYDGVVAEIRNNLLEGTVVVIDHGNNLKSIYSSLDQDVDVSIGDNVKAGDLIGTAANSATGETADGALIHFEVWKDGTLVDPAGYLQLEDK